MFFLLIYLTGYKLKVKVPLEGKEGFRSIFLDMRGLGSPLGSNDCFFSILVSSSVFIINDFYGADDA